MVANHGQVHDVGRVPPFMELEELATDLRLFQRLQIATSEPVELGLFARQFLQHSELEPAIIVSGHIPLGVHSVHLSFCLLLTQQRTNEELRHAVEGPLKGVIRHFEVEIGVRLRREGIGGAAVVLDVLEVLVFRRILLRAHEQHVLQEVRQAPVGRLLER